MVKNYILEQVKENDNFVYTNQSAALQTFIVKSAYNEVGIEANAQMFASK